MKSLQDLRVLSLAINLPGPLAAARLRELGATVVKIEPPEGDPLDHVRPEWYRTLHEGIEVERLNLKQPEALVRLHSQLARTDLLLTATRPAGLARLGLAWPELHARHPRVVHVAIVGYPEPHEDRAGHDLTYQAHLGLLTPPHLPRAMIADIGGAQEAVSAALALLLARERGQGTGHAQVSLAGAAKRFAEPLRHTLTAPGRELGGGLPVYDLYETQEGWIAVAALEPHFQQRLCSELGMTKPDRALLATRFRTRSAWQWEAWALERDLPIAALRNEFGSQAEPGYPSPE